jgi:FixJ family two-component response regulator
VEDDSVVRKYAATILRENGFRVLEAKTPVEAQVLGKRYEQMIDLLITDVVLPEMSGSMLADNLKSGSPDLKVIFMSGYSDRAISLLTKRGLFLQKPFKAPVLMKAIQQVLSH